MGYPKINPETGFPNTQSYADLYPAGKPENFLGTEMPIVTTTRVSTNGDTIQVTERGYSSQELDIWDYSVAVGNVQQ
jgi:hypothetical protein